MAATSEDIINTAQALRDEGWALDKITNAIIREKLSGGSFATIAPVLRSWKQTQLADVSTVPEKIPEQVRPAIESAVVGVWKSLRDWIEHSIKTGVEARLAASLNEQTELLAEQKRLEGENQILRENIKKLEDELKSANQEWQDCRNTYTKSYEKFTINELELAKITKDRTEELKNFESVKAAKEQELQRSFQEQAVLKERLSFQEAENKKLYNSNSLFEAELKKFHKLKEDYASLLEKKLANEAEFAKFQEQITYMKLQDKTKDERINALSKSLETSQAEMLKAKEEAAELRGKCKTLEHLHTKVAK